MGWRRRGRTPRECRPLEPHCQPQVGPGQRGGGQVPNKRKSCGRPAQGRFPPNAALAPPLRMALVHSQRRPTRQRRKLGPSESPARGPAAEFQVSRARTRMDGNPSIQARLRSMAVSRDHADALRLPRAAVLAAWPMRPGRESALDSDKRCGIGIESARNPFRIPRPNFGHARGTRFCRRREQQYLIPLLLVLLLLPPPSPTSLLLDAGAAARRPRDAEAGGRAAGAAGRPPSRTPRRCSEGGQGEVVGEEGDV